MLLCLPQQIHSASGNGLRVEGNPYLCVCGNRARNRGLELALGPEETAGTWKVSALLQRCLGWGVGGGASLPCIPPGHQGLACAPSRLPLVSALSQGPVSRPQ